MSRFFGEIRQVAYLVPDIEAAMEYWSRGLGVGPWYYNPKVPIENYTYRGQRYEPHNSVALANAGGLQIELLQPRNDVPSMYRDFLRAGHTGVQHVAYWTEQFDVDLESAEERGFKVCMSGEVGANGRFVYFEEPERRLRALSGDGDRTVGSRRSQGPAVQAHPRSRRGLGRQCAGPGVSRFAHAVISRFLATYLIETPLEPARVADVLAGEQSSGTFVRVAAESDALRARSRAVVETIDELDPLPVPSLHSALLESRHAAGPWRRARIEVSFPVANIGDNLPTLAATVAGNLYDLGEATGVRLERLRLDPAFRARFERPRHGVAGTRALTGVKTGPLLGTIIKPNVGLSAAETGALVGELCTAGVDFIKDDECCGNPEHAPTPDRIRAVMAAVRRAQDRSGKRVMVAFNITDEHERMLRHAELVAEEGGSCVMVSMNWVGFSSVQALRRRTDLAVHGHRNGYGMFSRHPALGMDFQPYQTLWRLCGVDHMHVHGLGGKFSQPDAEVVHSAHDCLTPLADPMDVADVVMPAFSSGQWAGTMPATIAAVPSADLMFMCGGGILAHPGGAAAGVASLRQAWHAISNEQSLEAAAREAPELREALAFFGAKH